MIASSIRWVVLSATVAACAVFGTGCYHDEYAEGPVVVESAEYRPMYYDGYVVYYDDYGRPFYYGNGNAVYYVPHTYVGYNTYIDHYRVYGPAYRRWYGSYGYRYRSYRYPTRGYSRGTYRRYR